MFKIILLLLCVSAQAQKVYNIRAEQRGQDIVILYSLESTSPCKVSLTLSQDNGSTWSNPLINVSGDIGNNITSGEKQIIWKVLEELEQLIGDRIIFKIVVNDRKSFEPEMVFVGGGFFMMGSIKGVDFEFPVHQVELSPFFIGKYEVTQAQWFDVMGYLPIKNNKCMKCPIENVSWLEVQLFIEKLNVFTGKNYRLPSEAEWEYAAKGAFYSKNYLYSGANSIDEVAWVYENSKSKSHEVGTKMPNELGIYDMSGNVMEWTLDWYSSYSSEAQLNPKGSNYGKGKVIRGGGYFDGNDRSNIGYQGCTTFSRFILQPNRKAEALGFRLVLPIE
jgi:formylglycine-generating enzyme required for sulfatase activity